MMIIFACKVKDSKSTNKNLLLAKINRQEQKEYGKGIRRPNNQLYIYIYLYICIYIYKPGLSKGGKDKKKNVAVSWTEYKKACDIIPQT